MTVSNYKPVPGERYPRTKPTPESYVVAQVKVRGAVEVGVTAIAASATASGREHLAIRYGRVLIYVEDRAALAALVRAVRQAQELADGLFGPEDDEFSRAEAQFRRHVARTGQMPARDRQPS